MQPVELSVSLTSAPSGHRHNNPILNVCIATGMPMIVIAIARLTQKYAKAIFKPPKSNHNKFPIVLMSFRFICTNLLSVPADVAHYTVHSNMLYGCNR